MHVSVHGATRTDTRPASAYSVAQLISTDEGPVGYAGKVEDQIEAYDYAIEEVKSRPIPPAELPPVGGHGNVVAIMNIAEQNVNME